MILDIAEFIGTHIQEIFVFFVVFVAGYWKGGGFA